jgi:predicted alpha-1,2-mannosidase
MGQSKAAKFSDYVNTLRGSNSFPEYSRGNTFPAVAVPFGFNFWSPMTDANSTKWIYQYAKTKIEAFTISHMPSPWISDRQTFQFMPMSDKLVTNRAARAAGFSHSEETAKAHYYSVKFHNRIVTEIAPTDHAAIVRFTFPTDHSFLLFDSVDGLPGSIELDAAEGTISGYTDHVDGFLKNVPRMYVYATFSRPVAEAAKVEQQRDITSWVRFDTSADRVVEMRIATSFISVEQAKANLLEELDGKSFEQVKEEAQAAWDRLLGKIEVEGASEDQLVTLYSNLYRLFLYPNSAWENVGGKPMYATPYVKGNPVKEGKVYVNNGFWDTYRTTWPMYALLTPELAGEMMDGFLRGQTDGGAIARWSAPGWVDCMVGTNSDIIIADLYAKGIRNFDIQTAYESMLRNATVYSDDPAVGRKGLNRSIFLGYTPQDQVGESACWSLEGCLNDFGIAQLAAALGKDEEAAYFLNRALQYVNLFSPAKGFFRGRNSDGSWSTPDEEYDPYRWGYEYTEGNAWDYCTAVPHDGQGLANLYGGRQALSEKTDAIFQASKHYDVGSYRQIIHEMTEGYDVDLGQYKHTNQPVHHVIYMYNYAGTPWKTQYYVREVINRLYDSGLGTGNGYLGDEDNGEMSAWYLFGAMGFYPVSVGRPEYAIGAPYFTKMTIHLDNGKDIVIEAPNVSDTNRYVQRLKLNGREYAKNFLLHEDLAGGALLQFEMGPEPSAWGSDEHSVPTSITTGTEVPRPLADLAEGGKVTASAGDSAGQAFDNDSLTEWTAPQSSAWIQYELPQAGVVTMYTITSGAGDAALDPKSWKLLGSHDGTEWTVLDTRANETFGWRRQTRPFAVKNDRAYKFYRLEIERNNGGSSLAVAEIEVLGRQS